ncbi:hypothetical protein [Allocoleopsis franciscana]|uniref:Uncharacterized protein n=1 Tax=Allocoleopsis franciscana PCC 7113 TaxID=1173027 RepID=K9WRV9_9CYAN|nr:hypothetical protein [Allocoleopsis franciscana]AFZ22292.1 hypothetical protein Mic7113_6730 [Allocoleopsis franciscana PCC 7113]
MRFKAESIVNGKVVESETDYLNLEEVKDVSPETHQAILSDASCVGAFLKHEAGNGTLITDRDRFPESRCQRQSFAGRDADTNPTTRNKS